MTSDEFDAFFERNIVRIKKNGRIQIRCRKWLWAVGSPEPEVAEREARHYFMLHASEGDYDEEATDDE